MAYMALFVLDDPACLESVLQKLAAEGYQGVTILESTGLHRHQKRLIHLRYLYSTAEEDESDNVTLFLILDSNDAAQHVLKLVESVVGNLDGSNNGVFAAWPLEMVKGLGNMSGKEKTVS
jgi:hypothetical protein